MGLRFDGLLTEASLLAELYHRGRLKGLDMHLEVFVPSIVHRSRKMRADVVVVKKGNIVACVEGKTPRGKIGRDTRQTRAYENLKIHHGIPTFWINSFAQIDSLVAQLVDLVAAHPICPIANTAPRFVPELPDIRGSMSVGLA